MYSTGDLEDIGKRKIPVGMGSEPRFFGLASIPTELC
jgi:hypothetical protein